MDDRQNKSGTSKPVTGKININCLLNICAKKLDLWLAGHMAVYFCDIIKTHGSESRGQAK